MTNQAGLIKAFASNGLKKYCKLPGDVFDPTNHEALTEHSDRFKEPGTVGQVIKAGFTLEACRSGRGQERITTRDDDDDDDYGPKPLHTNLSLLLG
jgi:hypothetical protein